MKTLLLNRKVALLGGVLVSLSLASCASKPADTSSATPQVEAASATPANGTASQSAGDGSKASATANDAKTSAVNATSTGQDAKGAPKSADTAPSSSTTASNDAGGSWSDTSSSGTTLSNPDDPWEGFNRAMFSFNDTLDKYLLKPVAKGYKDYVPTFAQEGVSNFFSNLGEISNLTNNALQGKKNGFVVSTWRFLINSTVGVFGLFDVASHLGLHKFDEDFGQTLGYWGVSSGPYLVLPFFGPSTVRDASGMGVDYMNYDAFNELDPNQDQKIGRWALYAVQKRASLLSAESLIIGDRYSFIRDVYLQQRQNEVYDGHPPQKPVKKAANDSQDSWGDSSDSTDSWGDSSGSSSSTSGGTDSWGDSASSQDSSAAPSTDSWGDPTGSANTDTSSASGSASVKTTTAPSAASTSTSTSK